ncbi:MAG: DUF4838 domain-containing protein [Armatimonadetes bacterium]|nr:DUF4838 domain-containing protein [Armatimonadota bacterium]
MKAALTIGLGAVPLLWALLPAAAQSGPRNVSVTFNGETEVAGYLPADVWHTVTASYRYPGGTHLLTNTYLVITRGNDPLTGFYLGYHVPTNQLAIVKHGFWNATEATGTPGETGKVIENDQGYLDCEHTVVEVTPNTVSVAYRVKFKPGRLKGSCNVFMYIEDKDVKYEGFTVMGSVGIEGDTAVHRTDMPAAWRNALRPQGGAAEPLLLADRGEARYRLLIPADARRIEQKAAADLAHYLGLITGAQFPVVTEGQAGRGDSPVISLGRTGLLANSRCAWKNADLAAEGYALEVVGGNVYLYGGSGRGLMHGVYALLEEDLGCRWYSLTSVDTPRQRRLTVSLVPRKYVPPLELRDPYILKMHEPNWSLHNRTNTPHARVPMAWGGSLRYHLMGHTYAWYFPTEQYFAEHPEYYALVNGKRQPSQLCHTNEDVIRISIEKTCEIFRNHPEVTITAIGPNDGRGFCDCPGCKRLDDENGGRSGSFFYMVNRIAEGVKKEFPDHHLISLAYLDYARPPTNLKVDPYIIIQLCTDSHAWKYQFCYQRESREFQELLRAWQATGAKVFVWDYTTDYVHYLLPMPNWQVVAENTRFMVRHGVAGIMYESEGNDVDEMRAWVWAKQLWNPALNTKELLHDFVFGYYKEAAAPLWEYQLRLWDYWEKWHAVPHRCGVASGHPLLNNLQCSYAPDGPMFTPEFMAAMRRDIEEAEGLAASDEIRQRVRKVRLPLLYLELSQGLGYYNEFGDFVYGPAMNRPRGERQALQAALDEFRALCQQYEISTLGIVGNVAYVTDKWQACLDAEGPGPSRIFLPAEWIFVADPEDRGVTERWYADPRHYQAARTLTVWGDDGPWREAALAPDQARLHINRGVGWEQQGFPGLDGYGWYFQNLTVPGSLAARPHLYLYLRRVNEEAWIYLNGELVAERTYASTGKAVGDLVGTPIAVDVAKWLRPGAENQLAIRVTHATGLGGITFPGMLIGTEAECTVEELDSYRQ